MTINNFSVILTAEKQDYGPERKKHAPRVSPRSARNGKAMLQMHTNSFMNMYRPYVLLGTILPSADKAEWFNKSCLAKAGSSGNPGPGVFMHMPE